MGKKTEKAFIREPKRAVADVTVFCFSRQPVSAREAEKVKSENGVVVLGYSISQNEYIRVVKEASSDLIVLLDGDRLPWTVLPSIVQQYIRTEKDGIGYLVSGKRKLWMGNIQSGWSVDREIGDSPVLIGKKSAFLKAYGGSDLAGGVIAGVAYSMQKTGGAEFVGLTAGAKECPPIVRETGKWELWRNYTWRIPGLYLLS
ncbi:MAG: hypothetical protein K2L23_04535 [Odoribacter sp.]|nr:hypothetical protein [Odoribacter sp.]